MNKVYRKIVAYNPSTNTVSCLKMLPYEMAIDDKASDEAFFEVYMQTDKVAEMVVGVSIGGDIYQLSPASYGTYIKENSSTMGFINKSKFLVAVASYHKKNNIPFDIY